MSMISQWDHMIGYGRFFLWVLKGLKLAPIDMSDAWVFGMVWDIFMKPPAQSQRPPK